MLQDAEGNLWFGTSEGASRYDGHTWKTFTGAVSRKFGKVEIAAGGTLFLDLIGDLAPDAQAKLPELLEDRTFTRVGGVRTLEAQVRIMAATNRFQLSGGIRSSGWWFFNQIRVT